MANYNQEWEAIGRNIQEAVNKAVSSQDFQKLNQNIHRIVDRVVPGSPVSHAAANYIKRQDVDCLYRNTSHELTAATARLVGGILLLAGGFGMLFAETGSGVPVLEVPALTAMMCIMMSAGAVLIPCGYFPRKRLRRFRIYRKTMGYSTSCSIGVLAANAGKSVDYVRRDLQRMIRAGLFREGHLNNEKTHLITSHETFRYYEQSRLLLEERQRQDQEEEKKRATRDPRVQEMLDKGREFVARIRSSNDAIPGEEISAKMDHMESIIRRIFQRVEADPTVIPDLKKLMDYYLPMTVKLLDAYAEMDAQPVQGETIRSAKQEIEGTLDTLNCAYEKLLDDLFADTAMDVSSDISVLNTLLAQEGLTDDDFKNTGE